MSKSVQITNLIYGIPSFCNAGTGRLLTFHGGREFRPIYHRRKDSFISSNKMILVTGDYFWGS